MQNMAKVSTATAGSITLGESLRHETGRPWHYHGTQGGSQLRNPGRLIFSLPLLSQDAVRLWMCVWEETLRRRHLIANFPCTETKSLICVNRAFTTALLSGWRTADRTQPSCEHRSAPLTTLAVGMASRCRRNHSTASGNMKFKLLFCAGEQP